MNDRMTYSAEEKLSKGYFYAPYIPLMYISLHDENMTLRYFDLRDKIDRDLVMNDTQRHFRDYHKAHANCPKCGSSHTSQTLMGFTLDANNPSAYRDENGARCGRCEWSGIVHDLVPQ